MATDGSLWPLLTVFWRSQKTSHHQHVCLSSDKFGLLHKLDFANGQLLSAGDWSNHCGDVHRLSKIMKMLNPLQIPLDFKTNPRESHESMQDGRWTEWILQCPSAVEAKLADFGLALYVGRKFSVCLAQGSGWQRARGGLTVCVIFLFEAEGTAQTSNSTCFWKLLQGVAYCSAWYRMYIISLRFIGGLEIQRRSISPKEFFWADSSHQRNRKESCHLRVRMLSLQNTLWNHSTNQPASFRQALMPLSRIVRVTQVPKVCQEDSG